MCVCVCVCAWKIKIFITLNIYIYIYIWYSAQNITNAYYADDIALLANALVAAESLLHRLERSSGSIVFQVNTDETEFKSFN